MRTLIAIGMMLALVGCSEPSTTIQPIHAWIIDRKGSILFREYYSEKGQCGYVTTGWGEAPTGVFEGNVNYRESHYFQTADQAIAYVEQYCKP